jgi:hypothetical protein
MPSDFDWIFMRDPYWRERPKEEAPAIPPSHPTDAPETRTSPRRSIGSRATPQPRKAEPRG